MDVTLKNGVTL